MESVIITFIFFMGAFLFILTIMGFLGYIFESIAVFRMMKQRNMENPGLAWVPIIHNYAIGSVHDDIKREQGKNSYLRFFMLACSVICIITNIYITISIIPWITAILKSGFSSNLYLSSPMFSSKFNPGNMMVFSWATHIAQFSALALIVIYLICLNIIFQKYAPKKQSYFVCSIIFSIIPIVPFIPGLFLLKASQNDPAQNQPQNSQRVVVHR